MDSWLAKWTTGCRAAWGKSLVPRARGAVTTVTTVSPLWAAVSESRARLVNTLRDELSLSTPFVPCGGAAVGSVSPGYGGAGAGVGTGSRWVRVAWSRQRASPRRLPSARQRGSWRPGNTMQGFFCAALSGFVLQLWSLNVSV